MLIGRAGDRLLAVLGQPLGDVQTAHILDNRLAVTSASRNPASVKFGASGSEGSRCEPVTAIARTLPDFA